LFSVFCFVFVSAAVPIVAGLFLWAFIDVRRGVVANAIFEQSSL